MARRDQKTIHVRVSEDMQNAIEARKDTAFISSTNRVVERDLARYYHLLDEARKEACRQLSDDEQALIIDSLNGVMMDARTMRILPHQISDAISIDRLDGKWGVDGQALTEKLEAMTPFELAAIVDGVEVFWAAVSRGEDVDARGGLVRGGKDHL